MRNQIIKKTDNSLIYLNLIFAMAVVTANVAAGKLIKIGWMVTTSGVFAYAVTFLVTDIIDEIWGKKEAEKAVIRSLFIQFFASFLILTCQWLPSAPFAMERSKAFNLVLGQNWRFAVASTSAYIVSQTNDVYLFSFWGKLTKGKWKWLRNNGSTMLSQLLDTAIFITIAFWGIVPDLWLMIISQYTLKLIIAACDTPFFYFFTKGHNYKEVLALEE